MSSFKLVRESGRLKPRHFYGNALRIAHECGCDYYMTVHDDHRARVHRANSNNYTDLESLHVCCPKCISKMVPIHSSFNNDNTQVFKCVICEGIRGRG